MGPEIWPSIYKLTGLKDLDLSGNKIAKISNKKIKKMKQLESVDLSSNKLTSIPPFGGLSQLKKLDVSRNDLTSLALGLKNLFLSDFDCSHNQLTATPDGLFASTTNLATTLRTLDISFNSIASLSPDIQKLPEIRDFDASNNLLTSLPTGLQRICLTSCSSAIFPTTVLPQCVSRLIKMIAVIDGREHTSVIHFVFMLLLILHSNLSLHMYDYVLVTIIQ